MHIRFCCKLFQLGFMHVWINPQLELSPQDTKSIPRHGKGISGTKTISRDVCSNWLNSLLYPFLPLISSPCSQVAARGSSSLRSFLSMANNTCRFATSSFLKYRVGPPRKWLSQENTGALAQSFAGVAKPSRARSIACRA
jgi:hypothetical protein